MSEQINMTGTEHEFCLRCGRRLKNPNARAIGYGAVCLRKMTRPEKSHQLFGTDNKKDGLP